jgi:hypothetical protein
MSDLVDVVASRQPSAITFVGGCVPEHHQKNTRQISRVEASRGYRTPIDKNVSIENHCVPDLLMNLNG